MRKTARLSKCSMYRYVLTRTWDPKKSVVVWVMLNPSKADHVTDDPTVKKCVGFSKAWGYGGIVVINLYAYRATDPLDLVFVGLEKAIGPNNREECEKVLKTVPSGPSLVIAAWGAQYHAPAADMIALIRECGHTSLCLGLNLNGTPKHPLYVRYDATLLTYYLPGEYRCLARS